ncbi:MAG: AzlC family ABC transporter permease [Deferribacteraceae bacterium]|jgi:4-azaleucine resistance transporter AzlC|nr:AzlC family ABC transporter permease [Deferribacteraceae bacterium]
MLKASLIFALKTSLPVILGYLAIGSAFGLIIQNNSYPISLAIFMSILIYAGAGQYAAAGLFAAGSGYAEAALTVFLINSRHMIYGFSMRDKFQNALPYTPYLIFGLTDETFGLLSAAKIPPELPRARVYFYITLFNQISWVLGTVAGFYIGEVIPFDFRGVEFALTALFVVLLMEQWKNRRDNSPFIIALVSTALAFLIFGAKNMLIAAFPLSILGAIGASLKKIKDA